MSDERNYELHEFDEWSRNFAACAANGGEFGAALRRVASRHCERSEAIQGKSVWKAIDLDCFVPRNDAKRIKRQRQPNLCPFRHLRLKFSQTNLRNSCNS